MDPLLVLTDASRNDEARDAVIGFDQLGPAVVRGAYRVERDGIRIISARATEPHGEASCSMKL